MRILDQINSQNAMQELHGFLNGKIKITTSLFGTRTIEVMRTQGNKEIKSHFNFNHVVKLVHEAAQKTFNPLELGRSDTTQSLKREVTEKFYGLKVIKSLTAASKTAEKTTSCVAKFFLALRNLGSTSLSKREMQFSTLDAQKKEALTLSLLEEADNMEKTYKTFLSSTPETLHLAVPITIKRVKELFEKRFLPSRDQESKKSFSEKVKSLQENFNSAVIKINKEFDDMRPLNSQEGSAKDIQELALLTLKLNAISYKKTDYEFECQELYANTLNSPVIVPYNHD